MELQWPLILFTVFVAWSAGLFGAQCIAGLKGEASKAQVVATIVSAVLLAIGGIAVLFHLRHGERIFNGFGNPTSGITQELIAIVAILALMVVFFIQARKNEGKPAKWLAIAGIVVAVVLVVVMAHSYLMASRPAWDSVLWILVTLGTACALGPCTFAVLASVLDPEAKPAVTGLAALTGAAIGAVTSAVYAFSLNGISSQFSSVGYYFDVTHPTNALIDLGSLTNVLSGDNAMLVWVGVIAVGAVAPVVAALMGKLKGNWKLWGTVSVACALVGAVCIRVLFYNMGFLFFMFY